MASTPSGGEAVESILRIRWVTWSPLPYWIDRFNALADSSGVELEVVFMRGSEASYAFKIDSSTWRFHSRVVDSRPGKAGFGRPSVMPRTLQSLARRSRGTHLVMPYADGTFLLAAAGSLVRGMPYSLFVASTANDSRSSGPLTEIIKRWIFRNADRCLVTGPLQADYVRGYHPRARISIIGNPVDVSRFAIAETGDAKRRTRVRGELGWSDRTVIGYVGRLSPEKDLPTLITAASTLTEKGLPVTVAMAGSGPAETSLRRQSSELSTDVRFLGFLDGLELGDFYRSIDIFCLPSASEPWGLVVNEAMAMGVPVVITDRAGARSLVEDGTSGLIFPAGNVSALAHQLERLVRSSTTRKDLANAAFRSIGAHTVSAWTRAVVASLSSDPATLQVPTLMRNRSSRLSMRLTTIWSTYGDYHVARVKALEQQGFNVVPFARCDNDPEYPFFAAKPDALVVVNRGSCNRVRPIRSLWRTWRLLRRNLPDVVLTAGYETTESLAALVYARTTRRKGGCRPTIVLMSDNRAEDHSRNRLVERVKSLYVRAFDGFLTSGSAARDYLHQLGVPARRIELGYACVDNERIKALVEHRRAAVSETRLGVGCFLCIARLVEKKNVLGIIRAYNSFVGCLPASEVAMPLVICGAGPERIGIERLVDQLGLAGSVRLIGEVRGLESMAEHLANCRALILASGSNETWGLVVNEAMAASCPVIVSKQSGCARDLVEEGVNGFTFDSSDSAELARHMLWVQTNQGRLDAMGRRSREIIDRFSPEHFAQSATKLVMESA